MTIDYDDAEKTLSNCYTSAVWNTPDAVLKFIGNNKESLEAVFSSKTQSYREVLLGCAVAKYSDLSCNIRHPYKRQGEDAFNGRALDEKVISPFLLSREIPCSKGPYLATFRRSITFTEETGKGLRDRKGYDAFLDLISVLEKMEKKEDVRVAITALLKCFVDLREKSAVRLIQINRLRTEQYTVFLDQLLDTQSGGLIPMLLTDGVFSAVNEYINAGWRIERQGPNSADAVAGVPGDITIYKDDKILKAVEVTERTVDAYRVDSTFFSKIAVNSVSEYLFVYTDCPPDASARDRAKLYFAQGYDINFISIENLIIMLLGMLGGSFGKILNDKLYELFSSSKVMATVKVAWNNALKKAIMV